MLITFYHLLILILLLLLSAAFILSFILLHLPTNTDSKPVLLLFFSNPKNTLSLSSSLIWFSVAFCIALGFVIDVFLIKVDKVRIRGIRLIFLFHKKEFSVFLNQVCFTLGWFSGIGLGLESVLILKVSSSILSSANLRG